MHRKLLRILLVLVALALPAHADRKRIQDNPARSPAAPAASDLLWATKAPYGSGNDFRLPLGDITLSILGDVDYTGGDPDVGDILIFDGTAWAPGPGNDSATLDGDYGDFTCVANTCDLDSDVVTAAEAADLWVFIAGDASLGTMTWANAAGPAIADEAASDTNPTLIPNRASMDDGVGHNGSDCPDMIEAGAEVAAFCNGVVGLGSESGSGVVVTLRDNGVLAFAEDSTNGTQALKFTAPASLSGNVTCTLRDATAFIPSTCVYTGAVASAIVMNDTVTDSPPVTFTPATGPSISIYANDAVNGGLNVETDDASDTLVHMDNAGAGEMDLWVRGDIAFDDFLTGPNVLVTNLFQITPAASAPATCAIGDFYVDTSGAYCGCAATNTWEKMNATTGTCV